MTTMYNVYADAQNAGDWSGLDNENTGSFATLEEAQLAFANYTHNAVEGAGVITLFLTFNGEILAETEAISL